MRYRSVYLDVTGSFGSSMIIKVGSSSVPIQYCSPDHLFSDLRYGKHEHILKLEYCVLDYHLCSFGRASLNFGLLRDRVEFCTQLNSIRKTDLIAQPRTRQLGMILLQFHNIMILKL
jgi:hypothetical protein